MKAREMQNDTQRDQTVAMAAIRNVSFIGVGHMGAAMAGQLAGKGFAVTVYDIDASACAAFAKSHAARIASSPADAAMGADAVILMLPNAGIVREVLFEQGLAAHMQAGSVAIDMGTSSPDATRKISAELSAMGIGYLDAPVMGGVAFAKDATLEIMVGGPADIVERCTPVFQAMGHKLWLCGGIGNADMLKVITNYINACALINTLEAMVLGRKFGLDSQTMAEAIDAMCNGRQHPIVKKIIPHALTRTYGTGMTLQLIAKDVKIAVDVAHDIGAVVPLAETTASLWCAASKELGGNHDQTEIVRYWEKASGIDL